MTIIRTTALALIAAVALFFGSVAPAIATDPEISRALELINAKRYPEAQKIFEAKAMRGDRDAAYYLGLMYLNSQGAKNSPQVMIDWFTMAAQKGHPDAQFQLGEIYSTGSIVKRDMSKALYWYDLAAKQRHAKSIGKLGYIYYAGDGVRPDRAKGLKLLELGANNGDPASMASYGVILMSGGPGHKPDPAKAAPYLDKAGRRGNVVAMYHLAQLYYTGAGVPLDKKTALQLLQQAAVRGYAPAQEALGNMDRKGIIRIDR